MSFHEKTTSVSLLICLYILYYFINQALKLPITAQLNTELTTLLIKVILVTILVEIIGHTLLAIVNYQQANEQPDERDKQLGLLAYRNAYYVLSFCVITCLIHVQLAEYFGAYFSYSQLPLFENMIFLIVVSFLVAEIVKLASQLYYAHRGIHD